MDQAQTKMTKEQSLNFIRNQFRDAVLMSGELCSQKEENGNNIYYFDEDDNFSKIADKKAAITELNKLFENLSNGSIIDDFKQILMLYNNPKNLRSAFEEKHKDIKSKEIRTVMCEEIRKMIKPIEEKFGFTLQDDMKEFDEFLRTGGYENIKINSNKPIKITNYSRESLGRVQEVIQNNIGENFLFKENQLNEDYKISINKEFRSACVIDISGFSEEKQKSIHKEISNFNAALMIDGKIYLPYLRWTGSMITKFRDHLNLGDEDIVESFGVKNIYEDFGLVAKESKNFPKPLKILEMLCPNSLGGLTNKQIEQNDIKQAADQSLVVNPSDPSVPQQIENFLSCGLLCNEKNKN